MLTLGGVKLCVATKLSSRAECSLCALADCGSVCSMGNGINWKGQVFPHMRNFTASHKMTGVGNALKRHYANFLEAYEAVSQWFAPCSDFPT